MNTINTDSADLSTILHQQRDTRGVVTLTLNQPESFNALGDAMLAALQQALDRLATDAQARVLVLAAEGKAFCPGHNLREMSQISGQASPQAGFQDLFDRCSRVMLTLQKLPIPVIARVQGVATAAGCQLVAQCDLAVASTAAKFGVNGIDVGLFCSTPSVPLVRNLSAKKAMEMLLTGGFISAEEALAQGLVNRVAAPDQLDAAVEELVQAIVGKPRAALAMGKSLFYRQREMGVEGAYQLASQTMALNMMDGCAQEGVRAFAERRAPRWKVAP